MSSIKKDVHVEFYGSLLPSHLLQTISMPDSTPAPGRLYVPCPYYRIFVFFASSPEPPSRGWGRHIHARLLK